MPPPPIRELKRLTDYEQVILDVRLYGAKLDGTTDDGPALQAALDRLHVLRGGTILIPGVMKLGTGVSRSFTSPQQASVVRLLGDYSRSEIKVGVGNSNIAINLGGMESLVIEGLNFSGTTSGGNADALKVLSITQTKQALITGCGFWGLYSVASGGHIIDVNGANLRVKDCAFRGCSGNGATGNSVIHLNNAGGCEVEDTDFMDHGDWKGAFVSRTGDGTAGAWIIIQDQGTIVASDSQEVFRFRNLKMDEGAQKGIFIVPNTAFAKVLRVEVENVFVNVCSLANSAGVWGRWVASLRIRNLWAGYASLGQNDAVYVTGVDRVTLENPTALLKANRFTFDGGCPQVLIIEPNDQGDAYIENFGTFPQPAVYVVIQQGIPRLPNMTTAVKNALANPKMGQMVYDTTVPGTYVYDGAVWRKVTVV